MSRQLMTIGELARETQLSPRAIRYYETLKLIPTPVRSDSNYRLFDSQAVDRLRVIRNCRALGFSIEEISELLGRVTAWLNIWNTVPPPWVPNAPYCST